MFYTPCLRGYNGAGKWGEPAARGSPITSGYYFSGHNHTIAPHYVGLPPVLGTNHTRACPILGLPQCRGAPPNTGLPYPWPLPINAPPYQATLNHGLLEQFWLIQLLGSPTVDLPYWWAPPYLATPNVGSPKKKLPIILVSPNTGLPLILGSP